MKFRTVLFGADISSDSPVDMRQQRDGRGMIWRHQIRLILFVLGDTLRDRSYRTSHRSRRVNDIWDDDMTKPKTDRAIVDRHQHISGFGSHGPQASRTLILSCGRERRMDFLGGFLR